MEHKTTHVRPPDEFNRYIGQYLSIMNSADVNNLRTSLTFCSVSGVILKSTGFSWSFDFCGCKHTLAVTVWILTSIDCISLCVVSDLAVHHEFAGLAQVFGEQRASHVAAERVLEHNHNTSHRCRHGSGPGRV